MQQIVCRHCFLATTGYDNNKGQVLHLFTTTIIFRAASIVLHNFTGINVQLIYDQIRMVEWIDDSRFNKPNVRTKAICEYVLHAERSRKVIRYC